MGDTGNPRVRILQVKRANRGAASPSCAAMGEASRGLHIRSAKAAARGQALDMRLYSSISSPHLTSCRHVAMDY